MTKNNRQAGSLNLNPPLSHFFVSVIDDDAADISGNFILEAGADAEGADSAVVKGVMLKSF